MQIAKVLSTKTPAQIKKACWMFLQTKLKKTAAVKWYQESLSPDGKAQVLVQHAAEQQIYQQYLSQKARAQMLTWRNLEGYPAQPEWTWRNLEGYPAQPGLIRSSVCHSVCGWVRAKRGIWSKGVFMRTKGNFSFQRALKEYYNYSLFSTYTEKSLYKKEISSNRKFGSYEKHTLSSELFL